MKNNKGDNIDPKKGMPQKDHWEKHMNFEEGADTADKAFFPRCGKYRPTTYTKTNECDH